MPGGHICGLRCIPDPAGKRAGRFRREVAGAVGPLFPAGAFWSSQCPGALPAGGGERGLWYALCYGAHDIGPLRGHVRRHWPESEPDGRQKAKDPFGAHAAISAGAAFVLCESGRHPGWGRRTAGCWGPELRLPGGHQAAGRRRYAPDGAEYAVPAAAPAQGPVAAEDCPAQRTDTLPGGAFVCSCWPWPAAAR